MPKLPKESIDRFFEHGVHVESRTIVLRENDGMDQDTAADIIKAFRLLSDGDKPIKLLISSFGGCWFSGLAIYDTIKACPCQVEAYALGPCMSMGSVILQAADVRVAYPNAVLMIHDGTEDIRDALPQSFINWADYAKKSRDLMYSIYAERSGRPKSFWRKKCANDTILTAAEAKEWGLVDSIFGD